MCTDENPNFITTFSKDHCASSPHAKIPEDRLWFHLKTSYATSSSTTSLHFLVLLVLDFIIIHHTFLKITYIVIVNLLSVVSKNISITTGQVVKESETFETWRANWDQWRWLSTQTSHSWCITWWQWNIFLSDRQ